jgi:3-oxoacyl-[acyl-carrier-protein] synthase II
MKSALNEAEVDPAHIDHICTHGTITPAGDECEILAIRQVFNSHRPTITGNKGSIGHTIGASGLNNLIFTAMSIQKETVLPIAGLVHPLEVDGYDANYVTEAKPQSVQKAMINALGFGGCNTTVIVAKYES